MAKNSTAAYHPRQIWETNLAPFVVAARKGATHAVDTANRERARRQRQWWRQRWLVASAAGLAIVGATAGVCVAIMRKSSTNRSGAPGARQRQQIGEPDGGRSTVDAGREKVAGVARTMRDKLKRGEPDQAGAKPDGRSQPATSPVGTGASDEPHNQTPVAGGGYRRS